MNRESVRDCTKTLLNSVVYRQCSPVDMADLCATAQKLTISRNTIVHGEGIPQHSMFALAKGDIAREKRDAEGALHRIDTSVCGSTVGALHVLDQDPAFATARCESDECVAYQITSAAVNQFLLERPRMARSVSVSLMQEVRKHTRAERSRLFEQQGSPLGALPVGAILVSATLESFFRSGMNALINHSLLGGERGPMFPQMHIQVPTRCAYVLGFKWTRQALEARVDTMGNTMAGLGVAVAPGLLMTPFSSILEAANAHKNTEPIFKRAMRGYTPRLVREVIFGVGLNQLSDFAAERMPFDGPLVRNMGGSMVAGLCAGYLSHVPHVVSTLMLNDVSSKSMWDHFRGFVATSESRVPHYTPRFAMLRPVHVTALALLAPQGLSPRMMQIAGSFAILNGSIHLISNMN